ncbi:MAG: anthranilate 1,2-dioxygenase large subunit [Bradyrhizobium sp.]|jgi:anthranilate 1,2-dioxygenase large subunit|nr:anthranilate 1,2-dioxygenase large subunit [Bradyrhizobium sp.]
MLDHVTRTTDKTGRRVWPGDGLTRVPYWIFQDRDIYAVEQKRIFQGPTWNYLCLSIEVKNTGDFITTFVGDASIIVARDSDGELYAFENRCAHRGALIALEQRGNTKAFTCVYHAWSYDRQGNLKEVAFKDGIKGKGGMSASFCMEHHNPRKLRLAEAFGVVFGSFSNDVPPLEEYLGEEIYSRIGRVLGGRTPVILGRYTQSLPNNWKLYMENVKDSYHASILHLFFTTFELNRLSQTGGIIVDPSGGHHISFSAVDTTSADDKEYAQQNIRSDSEFRLADPSLLQSFKEFPDNVTLQILSTFPCFILQQIQNAIAVRQIVPRSVDRTDLHWTLLGFAEDTPEQRLTRLKQANLVGPAGYISMEDGCVGGFVQRGIAGAGDEEAVIEMGGAGADSSESRVTEASVRGFWKAYRTQMGL